LNLDSLCYSSAVSVPEFHKFMRPVLDIVRRQDNIHRKEVAELSADLLQLTEEDKLETIASGESKWLNRVGWALSYLRKARLLEATGRGRYVITDRGKSYLESAPDAIRPSDLQQFPEFADFSRRNGRRFPKDVEPSVLDVTPQEAMAQAHASIRAELADALLERLKQVSPARFEHIIVKLMLAIGYGGSRDDAGESLGRSGDGGIDGVIRQDRLGLDNIYLQAKRYKDNVIGTSEVNSFIGALTTRGASKGVFITTSSFSEPAKRNAASVPQLKLSLIDGEELAKLMIDYDLGVAPEATYELKRIDSDFFVEE
jgi:restriction system protein